MTGMNQLLRYAKARGDGLLPELEALLERLPPAADHANIIDFAAIRGARRQAGPNPVGALPQKLPDNVILFRRSVEVKGTCATPRPQIRKSRARRLTNRKG